MVIIVPLSVASVGSRYMGDRVYLLNNTSCRVVVMEEHDGHAANPGEEVLIKPGFVDRIPTMMIVTDSAVWFGGLRFTVSTLHVRDQADIQIPPLFAWDFDRGRTLTYELTTDGQLLYKGFPPIASNTSPWVYRAAIDPGMVFVDSRSVPSLVRAARRCFVANGADGVTTNGH